MLEISVNLLWNELDLKLFQDGRARIIDPIGQNHPNDNMYFAVSQLIIQNLDKSKDVGTYKCVVDDDAMNHNAAELNIDDILGEFLTECHGIDCQYCNFFVFQELKSHLSI